MSSFIADTSRHQAQQAAIPQRRAALIAGLAYVIITVLSLFAVSVFDGLTEADNPAATVDNIVNSEALFRSGLAAFIIVLIADVVVAPLLRILGFTIRARDDEHSHVVLNAASGDRSTPVVVVGWDVDARARVNRVVLSQLDGFAHDLHAYLTVGARVPTAP